MATREAFKPKDKTEELLHDVFVTFCEDGQSCFDILKYRHSGENPCATIREQEASGFGGAEEPLKFELTLETIRKAFEVNEKTFIPDSPESKTAGKTHEDYRKRFHLAWFTKDMCEGNLDAYDVMTLVQFGLYGEAIYG